jgi:hypothetical protein
MTPTQGERESRSQGEGPETSSFNQASHTEVLDLMADVLAELGHLKKWLITMRAVLERMTMWESRMQRQVARPVWRALGGNVPPQGGNAPPFDPMPPIYWKMVTTFEPFKNY